MWVSKGGEICCTICKAKARIPNAPCNCREDLPEIHKRISKFDGALVSYIGQLDDLAAKVEQGLAGAESREYFTGCATLLRIRKERYSAIRDAADLDQTDELVASVNKLKEQLAGRADGELIADLEKASSAKRSKRSSGRAKPVH